MQDSGSGPGISAADARSYDVSTQAMEMLLQHLPGMVYRCRNNRDWAMEFVTAGAYRLTGYSPADLLSGRVPYGEIIHPDDRDLVWAGVQAGLAEHRRYELTYRLVCADGSQKWVWEQGRGVFSDAGELLTLEGLILDITAQRNLEDERRRDHAQLEALVAERTQALQASEQRYRSIVESQAELISRFDSELTLTFVNSVSARCFGCRPEDLVGRNFLECVPPEEHAEVRARIAELQPGGAPHVLEHEIYLPDGSRRWMRWVNRALANDDGTLLEYQGVGWDITEQRRAEELIRIQRDLGAELAAVADLPVAMERLLEFACEIDGIDCGGVYVLDEDTRTLVLVAHRNLSSEFVAAVRQYGLDEAQGQTVLAGRPVYWRLDEAELGRELFAQEGLRSIVVLPVVYHGQALATLNLGSRTRDEHDPAVRDALEAIAARIGAVVARVRIQAALRESEHKFRTLAETVPAPIVIVQDGALRYANSAAVELLACPRDEIFRTPPWEFAHPEMRERMRERILGRARGEDRPRRYEFLLVGRDGREHWLDMSVALIEYEGRRAALGVALDITERKRREDEERRHRNQMTHASRLSTLGEMAGGLAHELAQPLSAILYYARGAASRLANGNAAAGEVADTLEKIAIQAARAAEFIHRVKTFARQSPPARSVADLNQVVREALAFAAPELREHGILLERELAPDLPAVCIDTIQIEQVLLNLLRNAIDAMQSLPPERRRALVRTFLGRGGVCASVRDSGPGIPPEVMSHIFDPFFTTRPEGTGLGLSISRTIVEDIHEGQLWVEPCRGPGAECGFTLPPDRGSADERAGTDGVHRR